MVWLRAILITMLAFGSAFSAPASRQDPPATPPAEQQQYGFYSGVVSDLAGDRVTVSRTVLGRTEDRSFLLSSETRVEGQLQANARVTVRFRSSDQGDVAVHIIVRSSPPRGKR